MRDYYEKSLFRVISKRHFYYLSAFICMAAELPINRYVKMMRLEAALLK